MSLNATDLSLIDKLLFEPVLRSKEFTPVLINPSRDKLEPAESDPDWLVYVKSVTQGATLRDVDAWKGSMYVAGTFIHFSEVSPREASDVNIRWFPNMYQYGYGKIADGRLRASHQGFCVGKSVPFRVMHSKFALRSATGTENALIDMLREAVIFTLLAKRYSWTVRLTVDRGATVEFMTSSEEARQLFRFREKPPDRNRRAALRHWVSRLGEDGEREPWYLRGAVDFKWEGINCKLCPARFTRERLIEQSAK